MILSEAPSTVLGFLPPQGIWHVQASTAVWGSAVPGDSLGGGPGSKAGQAWLQAHLASAFVDRVFFSYIRGVLIVLVGNFHFLIVEA